MIVNRHLCRKPEFWIFSCFPLSKIRNRVAWIAFPGEATIVRRAHQDETIRAGIVPFQVAISVKGAAWGVVARDPVLVGVVAGTDDDGIPPRDAIV